MSRDTAKARIRQNRYYARHRDRLLEESRLRRPHKAEYDKQYRKINAIQLRTENSMRYQRDKEKHTAYGKMYYAGLDYFARVARRLKQYKLTVTEYYSMWAEQAGCCAACGDAMSLIFHRRNSVHVDHNHTTSQVRGLLCSPCNVAYGMLKEQESRIVGLLRYHREHSNG